MKTQQIKIKKFKGLENFEKEVNGNHILLLGDNGVGKTTIIQAIEIALGKQTTVPPNAEGSYEITFDRNGTELKVKVDFKDGKPILKVRGNGISIDNNKSSIAQLFGAVEFNIEHFVGLSKTKTGRKEQVEIFKSFFSKELREELAVFENNVKNHTEERKELGRDIEKLKGAISLHEMTQLPDCELEKIQPTDTVETMLKLKAVNEANEKITTVSSGIENQKENIQGKLTQIADLNAKILLLNNEIKAIDAEVKKGLEYLKINNIKPTDDLEKLIEDAGTNNVNYQKAQTLLTDRKTLSKYTEEYGEATALIQSSREAIANAIRDEQGPINGLEYDDDQLVYNGIPVHPDSLSKSEITEIGFRLKLAENPELGIICIPEAESLGTERFMDIKALADKNNCQIIAEQVQRGTKELVIEFMTDELIS